MTGGHTQTNTRTPCTFQTSHFTTKIKHGINYHIKIQPSAARRDLLQHGQREGTANNYQRIDRPPAQTHTDADEPGSVHNTCSCWDFFFFLNKSVFDKQISCLNSELPSILGPLGTVSNRCLHDRTAFANNTFSIWRYFLRLIHIIYPCLHTVHDREQVIFVRARETMNCRTERVGSFLFKVSVTFSCFRRLWL